MGNDQSMIVKNEWWLYAIEDYYSFQFLSDSDSGDVGAIEILPHAAIECYEFLPGKIKQQINDWLSEPKTARFAAATLCLSVLIQRWVERHAFVPEWQLATWRPYQGPWNHPEDFLMEIVTAHPGGDGRAVRWNIVGLALELKHCTHDRNCTQIRKTEKHNRLSYQKRTAKELDDKASIGYSPLF